YPEDEHQQGMYRVRFNVPENGVWPKYKSAAKKTGVWAFNAAELELWKSAKQKIICEGEKKGAAIRKYAKKKPIGIGGCWGYSRNGIMLPIFHNIQPRDEVWALIDGDILHPS